MILILFLIIVLIVLLVLLKKFKSPRIETLNVISGGVGGGKTSSGICRIKRQLFKYYFLFKNRNIKKDYILLGSFPMGKEEKKTGRFYIRTCLFKKIYCYDLDMDILLMQKKLPQDEVILVCDEFSDIASQFDFNNPKVKDNIDEFISKFRHYTHGKGFIYVIDQSSANIFLQVRRRANYCYNMISSRKLFFLPIMIYEYRKIMISDEVQNKVELKDSVDENEVRKFIFFCNPFKYYDSFCYSDRYQAISTTLQLQNKYHKLKRNDLMKIKDKKKLYYECLKYDGIKKEDY